MKSAFSKPGFLATTEHSAHVWGKRPPPMRREAEWGKVATRVQRSKERGFIRGGRESQPACLHACHSIDSTPALTWQMKLMMQWTASFIKVTFMWNGTVLRQCLQFACHLKFFSWTKRGKFMKKYVSFFYPHFPLATEATFRFIVKEFCMPCVSFIVLKDV